MTLEEHMERRNKEIENMTLSQARDIIASRLSHSDMRIKFDKAVKMLLDCADKALEQESVLAKIRAEIEQGYCAVNSDYDIGRNYGLYMATQIIDNHKQESGEIKMTNEEAKGIIEKYLTLDSDTDSEYIQAQKVAVEALKQEPKTGRWLDWTDDRNDYLKCSICGYGEEGEVKFGEYTPYCPMCGSKMESEG